jgi:hypothetical protein
MSRSRPHPAFRSPGRLLVFCLLLSLPLGPGGCSDDDPEAPGVENLARAWQLTSCEYRHQTDGNLHVDLVTDGWAITLHLNDNGAFRYTWTPPGGGEQYYDGTWAIDGEVVKLTRDGFGFSWDFTAEVREESMTLSGAHAEYDFDDNGTPEPAIWNLAGRT